MEESQVFRQCGSCRKPIALMQKYYACSIASCRKTAYCSMPCFDAHTPVFRHKDAWAEERTAPKVREPEVRPAEQKPATMRMSSSSEVPSEILIVASKLKDYVRAKSGLNTSASVLDRLSTIVRLQCDKAIARAQSDNRKTLMDRDFVL